MGALHLRPYTPERCYWRGGYPYCTRVATKVLLNGWNEVIGHYCEQHAEKALAALKAPEGMK